MDPNNEVKCIHSNNFFAESIILARFRTVLDFGHFHKNEEERPY